MATPELVAIRITKAQLLSLPTAERELLVRMGLVMNDLQLMQRLMLAVEASEPQSPAAFDAYGAHLLNILLMTGGKVFEALEVHRKFFLSSPVRNDYWPRLPEKIRKASDAIKDIAGSSSILSKLRNQFAFHYHDAPLTNFIEGFEDDVSLSLYLGNPDGNTLHHYAVEAMFRSLVAVTGIPDPMKSMDKIEGQILSTSRTLGTFVNGITADALGRIFQGEIPSEKCSLSLSDFEHLQDVVFPPLMANT